MSGSIKMILSDKATLILTHSRTLYEHKDLIRELLEENDKLKNAMRNIVETGDKMSVKYEAVHLVKIAREALGDL